MKNSQRLQIITDKEYSAIYDLPIFNDAERRHYFSLTDLELDALKLRVVNGKDTSSKLYFILQLGYFKAKHLFFQFDYATVNDDAMFIVNTYMPNDHIPKKFPSRKFQNNSQANILQLLGFRNGSDEINAFIENNLDYLIRKTVNPHHIFSRLRNSLESNKYTLPPYSRLQDAIGTSLKNEEYRIIKILQQELTHDTRLALKNLLEIENIFYQITELKFDAKTFRTQEMQLELRKLEICNSIYLFSNKILPLLAISRKNIDYYSDLAKMYTVYRLKRLNVELAYLYLICYVHKRYEKVVKNLIQGFAYYVDKYNADAKKYADNHLPDPNATINQYRKKAGELIRWYTEDEMMESHGQAIQEKAYAVISKDDLIILSDALLADNNYTTTRLTWEYHKNNYRCILLNLRPLFKVFDFGVISESRDLLTAINYLKDVFKQDKKLCDMKLEDIPIRHIFPRKIISEFFENTHKNNKVINTYQYEFYIYNALRSFIKTGRVFANNSIEYKNFDEDINTPHNWAHAKEKILEDLNNPILLTSIDETLISLKNILEPLIIRVNQRAQSGENKHIKIKQHRDGNSSWTIPYPKRNTEMDNPFYDSVETITVSEVFDFIEQRCGFINAFKHIKPRYAKSKLDFLGIKATILANGTTQGIYQFSKRSNLKYQRLQTVEQNHIRLETLRCAAQIIIDYLTTLPIFNTYNLNAKQHGSIDGKKKKTKRQILKARYSPKYFGLDIGVVIMTMNLNHIPFVTNVIGANNYEGHFTYPMLMENITAINPDIISTDTAGTNNINDLLYYLIGKTHAACYRSLADKAETISGFDSPAKYDGLLINPKKQVNQKLIKAKWDDILPILVALLSHETNQLK